MAEERPLPQSPEAEASLLGALLLDPSRLDEVRARVQAEDFGREAHRRVFRVICELADAALEPSFQRVTELLREKGELSEVGGPAAVVALIESTPAAGHVSGYSAIVERNAVLRRLIGAAQSMVRLAMMSDDAGEATRRAQQLLFDVSQRRLHREIVTVGEALRELFERIDIANERGRGPALPTGFPTLDDRLGGGLHTGDLIIVAGRPGLGKTSFALNVMRNAALLRQAVCAVFSLEMTEEDLTLRLLSSLSEIDGGRLRRGALDMDELQAVSQASSQLMHRGIFIEECTRLTVTDVLTHSRKLQAREGLDLIVIDYLQLMEGASPDENRVQEVGSITRGLKAIARELSVPVVVLSQLSRQIERRTGGEPKLSDLRECVTGDTRVIDADSGRWVEVRSLAAGTRLLALDGDQKIKPFVLEDVWQTGIKPVFRVTSQTGRVIKATANHPFLTAHGWKPLAELEKTDLIATALRLPEHGREMPERAPKCRLLGYMTGDGTYGRHRAVGFISGDLDAFADVTRLIAEEWPEIKCRFKHQRPTYTEADFVRLYTNGYGRPYGNPLREWLRAMGIAGQIDRFKRVPVWVYEAGTVGARHFLVGYLATDGSVARQVSGGRLGWSIRFDTVSHGLASDVQRLLLRLGVVGTIASGTFNTKSTTPIYRLSVNRWRANVERFITSIDGVGKKGRLLKSVLAALPLHETNPGVFGLPRELSQHLASLGVGWRDQGRRMRRSTALVYADRLNDELLSTYGRSDVLWEAIRSIEPLGEEEVYDLRVPAAGNFLANGFVVHNSGSIEQDADVVMFLWRRDRDRQTQAAPILELRLAKHRNGPTGDFQLLFEYEYTRFRELSGAA